jgi:hypothetical protein
VDYNSDGAETDLYLLRIWKGRPGDGASIHSLHGRLQHVVSGEAHTFRGLPALAELFALMFGEKDPGQLRIEAAKSPDATAG